MRSPTLYLMITAGAAVIAALLLWPRWLGSPKPPLSPRDAGPSDAGTTTAVTSASAPPPQASATAGPSTSTAAPSPSTSAASSKPALCPEEMVYVAGNYCPFVAHRCDAYVGGDPDPTGDYRRDRLRRCQTYRDTLLCEGRPSRLQFCIDRYEYPGLVGVKPAVMSTYREARRACGAEGKRLCFADEWAFACEGPRTLPFPYGLERDPTHCQLDRPTPIPRRQALAQPRAVSMEVQRLDRRLASGSQPQCVSPFQVFDTVGNVAEWVIDRQGDSVRARAGGHWGKVRGTCRSLQSGQRSDFRSVQVGLRCCRNAADGRAARQLLDPDARLPKRRRITN